MVEVFKTNVTNNHQAQDLVDVIQYHFRDYKVNFDLDDCDHILRIECNREVAIDPMILFLSAMGVDAEVLADETPLIII